MLLIASLDTKTKTRESKLFYEQHYFHGEKFIVNYHAIAVNSNIVCSTIGFSCRKL